MEDDLEIFDLKIIEKEHGAYGGSCVTIAAGVYVYSPVEGYSHWTCLFRIAKAR